MSDPVLILFSKAPDDAKAKTRLRKNAMVSQNFVSNLHRAMVRDALSLFNHFPTLSKTAFWATDFHRAEISPFSEILALDSLQKGNNFAERFYHALLVVQQEFDSRGAIIIGSDCPYITPKILKEAIRQVRAGALVLGPSQQGGFYLLGIPKNCTIPDVSNCFNGFGESVQISEKFGQSPLLLPFLCDIDEYRDVLTLAAMVDLDDSVVLPTTGEYVKRARKTGELCL